MMVKRAIKQSEETFADFSADKIEAGRRFTYVADTDEWKEESVLVKIESTPFSQGAIRYAYRCKECSLPAIDDDENVRKKTSNLSQLVVDWTHARHWVVKNFIEPVDNELEAARDDVVVQNTAKHYGELFNRAQPPCKVDFLEASYIELDNGTLYAAEAFVEGDYVKYSNNSGWVLGDNHARNTPHAFSHFTFVASRGRLLIVDIQGVANLFTDPVIHSLRGPKFGGGDLGVRGVALFFHSHVCSPVCEALAMHKFDMWCGLKRPAELMAWRGRTTPSFSQIIRVPKSERSKLAQQIGLKVEDLVDHGDEEGQVAKNDVAGSSSSSAKEEEEKEEEEEKNGVAEPSSAAAASSATNAVEPFLAIPDAGVPLEAAPEACVHHHLGRMHASGRIAQLDDTFKGESAAPTKPCLGAAFYHFQMAANLGSVEAQLAMARLYLGTARDFLDDFDVPEDQPLAGRYLALAAERGSKAAIGIVGDNLRSGAMGFEQDWARAAEHYERFWQASEPECPDEYFGYDWTAPPDYELLARHAEMCQEGGHKLAQNLERANELYNEAAEAAMAAMKGRLSMRYYEKAAECE
jgi:elongation factor 2 kinase